MISLLRHNQTVQREDDGAIQFWRIKSHLRNHSSQVQHWSDDRWKSCLAAGGGSKRRYQYCSDNSGTILYLRALQGHSGNNLIDPTLQDNVLIQCGIFHHIYHIGCAFNLHSIINNGLIPGGQDSSRRQTVFFLPIDPRDKDHEDPEHIDFSVPRRARYVHSAWKKHQDAVFWVDIDLAIKEGLTFYQTRSNAIILQGTLPAYCIPKVVRLKTGEVLYEKSYLSPRTPPKISLRHDHDWSRGNDKLGSTVEQQPVGKLVQQSFGEVQRVKFSKTNPIQTQTNLWSIGETVKSIPPTTENWLRKQYYSARRTTWALRTSMRQTTSTTSTMTRTWTRASCTTWEHALRARSLRHTLMLGHMHHLAQVLSPVMSSMYMCVSPWVHLSHSLLRSVLHHPLPLLPSHALRAAHWARQPDHHATQPAHLREQGE